MANPEGSSSGGRSLPAAGHDADIWAAYPPWNATCTCDNCTRSVPSGGGSTFVCNICLGTASDAVVTICGHLFCWPCLTRWLTSGPNRKICAVCKAAVDNSKIIPIYGRNSTRPDEYARDGLAPRPTGGIPAPPPRPSSQFVTITFCNGLNVSLGYGNFPFGLIRISFNYVEPDSDPDQELDSPGINEPVQIGDEQILTNMFLCLCILSIGWLLSTC